MKLLRTQRRVADKEEETVDNSEKDRLEILEKVRTADRIRKKEKRNERSLEEWKEDCKADNERKRKEAENVDSVER